MPKRPPGENERRFNAPQMDEVDIVIVDNENISRHIIIEEKDRVYKFIGRDTPFI